LALALGALPGFCNICGTPTLFSVASRNFREHVICGSCCSWNRQRQIAAVLISQAVSYERQNKGFASIRDLPERIVV